MKKRDFKVLGGSLFLAGTMHQGSILFDGGKINMSNFLANFLPIISLALIGAVAVFVVIQNLKKRNNNANN